MRSLNRALFLLSLLSLTACGSRTVVHQAPPRGRTFRAVQIEEGLSTVDVPYSVRANLEGRLEKRLYERLDFERGGELTIQYRFVQFEPGSQGLRWLSGGIGHAGEGSLTVEAEFVDALGRRLASMQVESHIQMGPMGGDYNDVLRIAAKKIAAYTQEHFH